MGEGNELVGLAEAAQRVGVATWRVLYALNAGHVQDVEQVAGRRLFDRAAIDRLQAHFRTQGGPVAAPGSGG